MNERQIRITYADIATIHKSGEMLKQYLRSCGFDVEKNIQKLYLTEDILYFQTYEEPVKEPEAVGIGTWNET